MMYSTMSTAFALTGLFFLVGLITVGWILWAIRRAEDAAAVGPPGPFRCEDEATDDWIASKTTADIAGSVGDGA